MRSWPTLHTLRRTSHARSAARLALVMLSLSLLLSACTVGGSKSEPTPPPAPTTAPVATLTGDQISVGDLITRVNAAWPSVKTMRTTSWSGQQGTTIGTPAPDQDVLIEETVSPDSRRRIGISGGTPVDEQIAINGTAYFKGASVANAVAPFAGTETWVQVDPTIVPADSTVGQQLAYLTRPLGPPYDSVTEDLRARAATPGGTIDAGGRQCTVYTFVDTTANGEKIDYALSLDDQSLPCSLVQSAGGYANTTIYQFNDPSIVITAPTTATPVSGTPEG